jgi:hypothetical protein
MSACVECKASVQSGLLANCPKHPRTPTPSPERDELDSMLHSFVCQPITEARNMGYRAGETGKDDTELMLLIENTEEKAKVAIHHQTQIAQVRYALEKLQNLKDSLPPRHSYAERFHRLNQEEKDYHYSQHGQGYIHGWEDYRLNAADDLDTAILAQQTRLDELTNAPKGIGGDDEQ